MKLKLSSIKTDPDILDLRPVNAVFVSRYRQAMRSGDEFPKMVIDQDRKIISGNHRYAAMLAEYGEDHVVNVVSRKFATQADRIEEAVRQNTKHGNPLDGISRRRAVLKLIELGRDAGAVANLLGVSVKRIEDMAGMAVMVVGQAQPLKRGMEHMAGRTMSKGQYEAHRSLDRGVPAESMARQLVRWIHAGWIDTSHEATVEALHDLRVELDKFLPPKDGRQPEASSEPMSGSQPKG